MAKTKDFLLENSLRSASSLMGLQLFSRLFTFALNQAMFRLASPRAYGTAAIQFELLLSTILFLSREGVRNALLRSKKPGPATHNLSVLPILLGFPVALVAAYGYASSAGTEVRSQEYFLFSIAIYAAAAFLELMSEPMHNLAMLDFHTRIRVKAEGIGITSKALITFLILVFDAKKGQGSVALLAFACGQLGYGAAVVITYVCIYGTGHWRLNRLVSTSKKSSQYFDPELLLLALTMTYQSIVKHFLTEGDKLIVSWFSSLRDQAGYAVAVNYGSLIARIIFQPIEEASRGFFSKALSKNARQDGDSLAVRRATTALENLLSILTSFSTFVLLFGKSYLPIALHILLPRQYLSTSAPKVLSAWVWYIPFLAINGTLEAFFSSVATPQDLSLQNRWMCVFSAVYILAAASFFNFNLGDASLVYANILNLFARIMYTGIFIHKFYKRSSGDGLTWKSTLPAMACLQSMSISSLVIWASAKILKLSPMLSGKVTMTITRPLIIYVGTGIVIALVNVLVWWRFSGSRLSMPRSDPKSI